MPDPTTFGRWRRRAAGVEEITVRLDKGFFARRVVRCLQRLEVSYLLKVPNHRRVRRELRPWRRSSRAEAEGTLALDTHEVTETTHILTGRPGIHALTAWRAHNRGAAVEGRIKELGQHSVGRTAAADLDGNALLWSLGPSGRPRTTTLPPGTTLPGPRERTRGCLPTRSSS